MTANKNEQSLYKIYSFYNKNVSPRVAACQKAVFNELGFHIDQVFDQQFTHADFLNHVCRNVTDTKYIIIFDIDCIPTKKEWLSDLLRSLEQPRSISGAAQTANHLRDGKNLYVSPFFFGISTAYLKELNYPDMSPTDDMDAGQNLTEAVIKNGGNINYWWPTDIEVEEWALYHPVHTKFGHGTTYNDAVYHAFQSRFDKSGRFIKKCKSLLPAFTRFRLLFTRKK